MSSKAGFHRSASFVNRKKREYFNDFSDVRDTDLNIFRHVLHRESKLIEKSDIYNDITFGDNAILGINLGSKVKDALQQHIASYGSFQVMSSLVFGFGVNVLFSKSTNISYNISGMLFTVLMCIVLITSSLTLIVMSVTSYFVKRFMADFKYDEAYQYLKYYRPIRHFGRVSFYCSLISFISAIASYLYDKLPKINGIVSLSLLCCGLLIILLVLWYMLHPQLFILDKVTDISDASFSSKRRSNSDIKDEFIGSRFSLKGLSIHKSKSNVNWRESVIPKSPINEIDEASTPLKKSKTLYRIKTPIHTRDDDDLENALHHDGMDGTVADGE